MQQLNAIIEREGDGYVGLCPELDIASQGDTIESTGTNLQEAVELFCETADPLEIEGAVPQHFMKSSSNLVPPTASKSKRRQKILIS